MDIAKKIRERRPKIKEESIKIYLANLRKIAKKVGVDDFEDLDWLKDEKKILESLKDLKANTRKTYLATLVVVLDAFGDKYKEELEVFRKDMNEEIVKHKEEMAKNVKSEKQEKNWESLASLRKILLDYQNELKKREVFKRKWSDLSFREKDLLKMWMAGSLYILDDDNPPQRLDFNNMRIISKSDYDDLDEDELKKNFLVVVNRNKKFFSFGDYKTDKVYGVREVKVGKKLNSALNLYLKVRAGEELLLSDSRGNALSSTGLTKLLQKTFAPSGKKISANMLRHIYISERFPVEEQQEKEDVARRMGHSVNQQGQYSKKSEKQKID